MKINRLFFTLGFGCGGGCIHERDRSCIHAEGWACCIRQQGTNPSWIQLLQHWAWMLGCHPWYTVVPPLSIWSPLHSHHRPSTTRDDLPEGNPQCTTPDFSAVMLKVQGYDFQLTYRPGSEMRLSDTLSRLPNSKNNKVLETWQSSWHHPDRRNWSHQNRPDEFLHNQTEADQRWNCKGPCPEWPWPGHPHWLATNNPGTAHCTAGILGIQRWTSHGKWHSPQGQTSAHTYTPETRNPDTAAQWPPRVSRKLAISHVKVSSGAKINKGIEHLFQSCELCQELQPQQPQQPMQMHTKPGMPWVKMGTDLFEINGKSYLIISDYISRYPVVKELRSTTAEAVIAVMQETFGMLGVPREIISDNGPQCLTTFNEFCADWGIQHMTSSPRYAQSNGFIERQVRNIKPIIKKCLKANSDIHKALLNIRATPLDSTLPIPAELMFGRPIPTTLPSHTSQIALENYQEHVQQWSDQQKSYGDQRTWPLPPLLVGKPVRVLDKQSKTWFPGTITPQNKDRSYQILTEAGRSIIRNRQHLRDLTPHNDAPICTSTIPVDPPNSNGNTIINSAPTATLCKPTTTMVDRSPCTGAPETPKPVAETDKGGGQSPYKTRSGRMMCKPLRYYNIRPETIKWMKNLVPMSIKSKWVT